MFRERTDVVPRAVSKRSHQNFGRALILPWTGLTSIADLAGRGRLARVRVAGCGAPPFIAPATARRRVSSRAMRPSRRRTMQR